MGTPQFALPSLQAVKDGGHAIAAAYAQPPRPAGRGGRLRSSPVALWCDRNGIEVRTPRTLRDERVLAELAGLRPDYIVVAAYGLILPQAVIDIPRLGCINVHASLLPRWRGAAPIQRAIMAGDRETGICIMSMEAGLDTGPVHLSETITLDGIDAGEATDRLSVLGAELLARYLGSPDRFPPLIQSSEGATYASKIAKAECAIDPGRPAEEVARLVRAMAPSPGAWICFRHERIKILCADAVDGEGRPGELLDGRMTIACGRGALRVHRAQRPGRTPLHPKDLVLGFPMEKGEHVEVGRPSG